MQEHEINPIRKLNEDELQTVTGGCEACAADKVIRNSAAQVAMNFRSATASGIKPNAELKNFVSSAIDHGSAAIARIEQRHPEVYKAAK
jgi:bacteriocin-like protein